MNPTPHSEPVPSWPFQHPTRPADAGAPLLTTERAATPEAWVSRCTDRLVQLIPDEGVQRADLELVALDLLEDARFREVGAEAAAELHAREGMKSEDPHPPAKLVLAVPMPPQLLAGTGPRRHDTMRGADLERAVGWALGRAYPWLLKVEHPPGAGMLWAQMPGEHGEASNDPR